MPKTMMRDARNGRKRSAIPPTTEYHSPLPNQSETDREGDSHALQSLKGPSLGPGGESRVRRPGSKAADGLAFVGGKCGPGAPWHAAGNYEEPPAQCGKYTCCSHPADPRGCLRRLRSPAGPSYAILLS